MLLLTGKLLIVLLSCNLIFTGPSCTKHTIEDVTGYSTETNVETISFDNIIMELLSLVRSAQMSHFSIVRENYILAEHHICLNCGVSLEIATVNHLQTFQYSGKYLFSLKWVNSQLMVFSNASSNALFMNKPEIEDLLANYKLKTIETAPKFSFSTRGNRNQIVSTRRQADMPSWEAFARARKSF